MTHTDNDHRTLRILRPSSVYGKTGKTGLSRTAIHVLVKQGLFPKPVKLIAGGRHVGFIEAEVDAWIAERAAERDVPRPAKADLAQAA